jgi:hypothetical protein
MYDNFDYPSAGLNSGFKITSESVSEGYWDWEFSKGEFTTRFRGFFPYLAADKQSGWSAKNYYWGKDLIAFFNTFCDNTQITETCRKVSASINEKYPSREDQSTEQAIMEGAGLLYNALMDVARPNLGSLEWNIVLGYYLSVDKEGNDKYYLNLQKTRWQDENGEYVNDYPFAVGKNPRINPSLLLKKPGEVEPVADTYENALDASIQQIKAEVNGVVENTYTNPVTTPANGVTTSTEEDW